MTAVYEMIREAVLHKRIVVATYQRALQRNPGDTQTRYLLTRAAAEARVTNGVGSASACCCDAKSSDSAARERPPASPSPGSPRDPRRDALHHEIDVELHVVHCGDAELRRKRDSIRAQLHDAVADDAKRVALIVHTLR